MLPSAASGLRAAAGPAGAESAVAWGEGGSQREKGKHAGAKREKGKRATTIFTRFSLDIATARTHARHETKRFPGWGATLFPPTSDQHGDKNAM